MLRTQCAQCAAPLAHNAPRCGICKTRYCGRDCQKLHWKDGHKELCPVIKRRGGPEVIYAEKKNEEAVAVAAEKCAEDTKGQTCYICMEAVHRRTGEGLVRGCACGDRDGVASGTTGIAHVSCLAEQAEILRQEAEENNLDAKARTTAFRRWDTCSMCKQDYHGVVACALGWASWKTYLGRPETDWARRLAMTQLGNGLHEVKQHEDALSMRKTELAMLRRIGVSEGDLLCTQGNLANSYGKLGRLEEANQMYRDINSEYVKLLGEEHVRTLTAALNYASSLLQLKRFEEVKALLRKTIPMARRVLGESDETMLRMRGCFADALLNDPGATLGELREAVTTLEDTERIARRVFGGTHPFTGRIELPLREARSVLAARETPRA